MKDSMWTEIGGCSYGVAYGPKGVLYRRGCDSYVYRYEVKRSKWLKLGNRKALALAAGEDGIWITDKETISPYKWNETQKKFDAMGGLKAADIVAGVPG